METRVLFAYAIFAILVLSVAAFVAYTRYNSRDRKVARRRTREDEARAKRLHDRS